MNTRRNFMRGLSGLGAIIATGQAPAAIVRSMVAVRGAMFSGGGGDTVPPKGYRLVKCVTYTSGNAATNAVGLALVVMPETSRTNITAYVVKTETDGVTDTQWVWYNRTIDLAPNRFVVYETFGRAATNKVTWIDWTNAVTVTHNGRTWEGCHVCTVTRPDWAHGGACLDLPNDTFGGPTGMDFGDLLLTMGGVPLYTGYVTNGLTGQVIYFDNGFYKGELPQ